MKLELEDIRRLDIKPGQILVATLPVDTSTDRAREIQDQIRHYLPDGVKVMIVSDNVHLAVLNPQDLTDAILDAPTV